MALLLHKTVLVNFPMATTVTVQIAYPRVDPSDASGLVAVEVQRV